MSLIRYHLPSSQVRSANRLASLQDQYERLFAGSGRQSTLAPSGWSPSLNVYDDKEKYTVVLELPGVQKEELAISLQDGVLTVSGERKQEPATVDGRTFQSERQFGKFQRSVTLPAHVDSTAVVANYKDGLLTITLAKAEEARPRQIQVNVE